MSHSEVCASAYSLKAAMNQLSHLATTISEFGQKQTFSSSVTLAAGQLFSNELARRVAANRDPHRDSGFGRPQVAKIRLRMQQTHHLRDCPDRYVRRLSSEKKLMIQRPHAWPAIFSSTPAAPSCRGFSPNVGRRGEEPATG